SVSLVIDVAHAFVMFDNGHFGTFGDSADQSFASARHTEVHILSEREQFFDGVAVGGQNHLDSVDREMRERSLPCFDHCARNRLVGVNRFLSSAQNGGVTGFEAQAGGIGGHV